jgi:hypothetical protein
MARPEVTGKKIAPEAANLDAYSIEVFCQRHSISIPFYYKLRSKEPPETPREFEVGSRVLISKESAADWRREREASTAAKRHAREARPEDASA